MSHNFRLPPLSSLLSVFMTTIGGTIDLFHFGSCLGLRFISVPVLVCVSFRFLSWFAFHFGSCLGLRFILVPVLVCMGVSTS